VERLDDLLLELFLDCFHGYGSFAAPIWYFTLQDGGGKSIDEIQRRLSSWDVRGRLELEDLPEFHSAIREEKWIAKLQSTWRPLIRIQHSIEGNDIFDQPAQSQNSRLLQYQAERWGRPRGGNSIMALLPLSSPSKGSWLYPEHTAIPQLASRDSYWSHYLSRRTVSVKQKIELHQPRVVVLCGVGSESVQVWNAIAHEVFSAKGDPQIVERDGTNFVLMRHPVAHGVSNNYFDDIGRQIRSRLAV